MRRSRNVRNLTRVAAIVLAVVSVLVVSFPTRSALAAPIAPRVSFIGVQGHYVVAAGAPVDTVIGEVRATAADLSTPVRYSVSSDSAVAVNPITGVLTVAQSPSVSPSVARTFEVVATAGSHTTRAKFTLLVMPSSTLTHGITEEMWDEMKGTRIDDTKIATENLRTPTTQSVIAKIDRKFDLNNYSARYSGFLVAPTTGAYTFFISADDSAGLWIGSNGNPSSFSAKPIATQPKASYQYSWGAGTGQQSAPVTLVAGQVYAIKVLHKEAINWGDHVAVAWKAPGMTAPVNGNAANLIPQSALYPVSAIDWIAPVKPAHATISKITATTTTLSWRPATDVSGIDRYTVWRDGRKIAEIPADTRTHYHYNDVIGSGLHRYAVHAVDTRGNISTAASFSRIATGSSYDPLEKAVATGDASVIIDAADLVSAAQAEISSLLARQNDLISHLYTGVESVTYLPAPTGGPYMSPRAVAADRVIPIIRSNKAGSASLAVAGTSDVQSRFAVFGDSPLTTVNTAAATRLVQWLITGDGGAPKSTTSIAILNSKSAAMKSWLISNGIGTDSSITVCTASNFTTCFADKSLIIAGSKVLTDTHAPAMAAAVKLATRNKIPILWSGDYAYSNDKTQAAVFAVLEVDYNGSAYYPGHQAVYETRDAVVAMSSVVDQFQSLSTLLAHFANNDWNVDFTGWDCFGCASNPTAQTYMTNEFLGGANFLRDKLSDLDTRGVSIFNAPPAVYRLLKILVLLGDVYRRDVSFPSAPTKVSNSRFFRTYYTDFSVYNVRNHNAAQPDLGTFSWPIPASTPRFNGTHTFETKLDGYFTAVGVYVHPGQSFTVTRTDSAPVNIEISINTVRPTSTHEFTTYVRPKYLRSPFVVLQTGVPITLTSPHGGPLQIRVAGSTVPLDVSINVTNVGRHPVWDGTQTTPAFTKGIADSVYNWTEIKTPGIEIHSIRRLMLDTLQGPAFNTPEKLGESTFKYHFQSQYGVAGYTGAGLTTSDSVQRLCTENGLDCSNRSINKVPAISHFNADKGSCGYGCSGNPYDADWAYSVIGWGDSHEIGHNIQRFMIYDGKSTETTNDIYSAHTLGKWNKEVPYFWQGAAFTTKPEVTFNAIVAAQASADPVTFMKDVAWGTVETAEARGVRDIQWDVQRMHFYWHLVQQSRENTRVTFGNDGWDFWTLMNAIDREFFYAKSDQTRWDARQSALGFAGMTRVAAGALDNNSRTLVQASRLAKLDQRPFFDMWGITYSQEASDQVASFNYSPAEKKYWYYPTTFEGSSYFSGVAAGSVPVNGDVSTLPKVPVAFNFTDADLSSQSYPWPQTTRVAVKKSIALRTAVGAAAVVEFRANGAVIPGCAAVPTQTHDWTKPTGSPAGGVGGGAQEVVATCTWFPVNAGSFEITTNVTTTGTGWGQAVTLPITIQAYGTTDYPVVTSASSPSGLEGSTVVLRGKNLRTVSTVSYHGVNVPVIARSETRVTIVVPSVTPSQVNDVFTLFTATGYRVVTPNSFIVVKPVSSVSLASTTMTVNPGKVIPLNATVSPTYATNQALRWRSSNSTVATVSSTGRVVARQPGTTTISVVSVDSARTASVAVTVTNDVVTEVVAIRGETVHVDHNSSIDAQINLLPMNAVPTNLTWASSNATIATVSATGRVTGVAVGSTTLTVTATNGVTTTLPVVVNVAASSDDLNNTITGITTQMQFSKNNGANWNTYSGTNLPPLTGNVAIKLRKSGTTSPVKTLYFTDGVHSLTNPSTTMTSANVYLSDLSWTTHSNGWGNAELDMSNAGTGTDDGANLKINGVSFTKGLGVHADSTITYSLDGKYSQFLADVGADDGATGSIVFEVHGDGVSLYKSAVLRKVDGAQKVDVSVIGVTTLTLLVTNGGNGSSNDHGNWGGARLVPAVGSVQISPAALSTTPGTETMLAGTITAQPNVSATLSWVSSDTSIATVSNSGLVTGVAVGTARITATSSIGGVAGTSMVRVESPKMTSIAVNKNSLLLNPSGSETLNATVTTIGTVNYSLEWSTSNSSVATVDSSGNVSAVSVGSAVITVATSDGGFEASSLVTVSLVASVASGLTHSSLSLEPVADRAALRKSVASARSVAMMVRAIKTVPSTHPSLRIFTDGSRLTLGRSFMHLRLRGRWVGTSDLEVVTTYRVGRRRVGYKCSVPNKDVVASAVQCAIPRALRTAITHQNITITVTLK